MTSAGNTICGGCGLKLDVGERGVRKGRGMRGNNDGGLGI